MRRWRASCSLLVTAVLSCVVVARPRAQAPFTFEAASVKPNQSRACDRDGTLAGARFVMTCSTLRELITFAYPREDGRLRFDADLAGGPSWINVDRFDVAAKIPAGAGLGIDAGNTGAGRVTSADLAAIERVRQMAQALLVDRFRLTVHNELRELAVYELRMNRADGRLGSQLKTVDVDCATQRGSSSAPCGGFRMLGPGHIVGHGVTTSLLVQFLEAPSGRRVFDRTALHGTFDVELQYAPDRVQLRRPETPAAEPPGVSVFTAVREQLGLKLESTKASVDVLVIDRAEKPTPD